MLKKVEVSNFAIFKNIKIDFGAKLNVITGETGSGKSLLLDALCFGLGIGKAAPFIGKFSDTAQVKLTLDTTDGIQKKIKDLEIELDDTFEIRRTYNKATKASKYFIEGEVVPANVAKEILGSIFDYTAQNENNKLYELPHQLKFLDRLTGLEKTTKEYFGKYQEWNQLDIEIKALQEDEQRSVSRKDYLEYQLQEFKNISPELGEDLKLDERIKSLEASINSQNEFSSLENALNEDPNIIGTLKNLLKSIKAGEIQKDLRAAIEKLTEVSEKVTASISDIHQSREEMALLEKRRDQLFTIISKHGRTLEKANEAWKNFENELAELNSIPEKLKTAIDQRNKIEKELTKLANEISKKRKSGAASVESLVNKNLKDLEMKHAQFQLRLIPQETFTPSGLEIVEFFINTTGTIRPIKEIASGGEISRVLLALKCLVDSSSIDVFVFDEIDAALGGLAATAVGKRLKELSRKKQVLCITHLPQVACFADHHISVEKKSKEEAEPRVLQKPQRIEEISRMLAGKEKVSNEVKKVARDMIEQVQA